MTWKEAVKRSKEIQKYRDTIIPNYTAQHLAAAILAQNSELKKIRVQLSRYIKTEGCSCCQNVEPHRKAQDTLGELLVFKQYDDKSGYDFTP